MAPNPNQSNLVQVSEKESGAHASMATMGMLDGPWWISWAVPELLLGMLHAVLMTAVARAFGFAMVGQCI